MEHSMHLALEPFQAIKDGRKVIESRLYDEKRQTIKLGDTIEFTENDHPEPIVKAKVIGLLRYENFEMLFKDHDSKLFAGTDSEQLLKQIKQFYSDDDELKYGVVGVRFLLID